MASQDKITKQQVDVWGQELYATGTNLMSTSEVGIALTVGRYGNLNAINLQVQKKEESATNAAFEMAYRAAKGNPFYLGFKTGDPAALVVTDVSNAANVQQGLFSAKGVTTVILAAQVSDAMMAVLRQQLTSHPIDAVRIRLAGDQMIEQSVNDKNGQKMMEKFTCFFETLDKRGIDLGKAREQATAAAGRYLFKTGTGKAGAYTELAADGTFTIRADGSMAGTYAVQGDVLILTATTGEIYKAKLTGNSIVTPDGTVYERSADAVKAPVDAAKPPSAALTVDLIIQMVGAKIPDDIIISSIEKSGTKFNITPGDMVKLKGAGVSDAVLRAMLK